MGKELRRTVSGEGGLAQGHDARLNFALSGFKSNVSAMLPRKAFSWISVTRLVFGLLFCFLGASLVAGAIGPWTKQLSQPHQMIANLVLGSPRLSRSHHHRCGVDPSQKTATPGPESVRDRGHPHRQSHRLGTPGGAGRDPARDRSPNFDRVRPDAFALRRGGTTGGGKSEGRELRPEPGFVFAVVTLVLGCRRPQGNFLPGRALCQS